MAEYDRFNTRFKSICKKRGDDAEDAIVEQVHTAFVSCVPGLPENLMHDIAYFFVESCGRGDGDDRVTLLGAKLLEVLYLIEEEYDRVEESFDDTEWGYIRDIISEFAMDIPQEKLTYIMRQLVSRGIMDR